MSSCTAEADLRGEKRKEDDCPLGRKDAVGVLWALLSWAEQMSFSSSVLLFQMQSCPRINLTQVPPGSRSAE